MEGDPPHSPDAPLLELDGFAGPLDLLLDLARRQAVDIARISITTMVDQFVDAVAAMPRVDLPRVAEWLVMAAWLTWLKSRLLLPGELEEAKQGEAAGQVLLDRLAELEHVRATVEWLDDRPQLGREVFARGARQAPAGPAVIADLASLFQACLNVLEDAQDRQPAFYAPPRRVLWTPMQARARLLAAFSESSDAAELLTFLPTVPPQVADRAVWLRSAIASTLVAALELARETLLDLDQSLPFEAITLRAVKAPSELGDV